MSRDAAIFKYNLPAKITAIGKLNLHFAGSAPAGELHSCKEKGVMNVYICRYGSGGRADSAHGRGNVA